MGPGNDFKDGLLTHPLVFVHGKDQETFNIVTEQTTSIAALVKGLEIIEIISVNGSAPDGCGVFVVSEQCNVYMLVKVISSLHPYRPFKAHH